MTVRSLFVAWIAFSLTWGSFPPLAAAAASTCVAEDGRILFTDQDCPPGTRPGKTGGGNLIQTKRPRARQAEHPRPPSSEPDATPPSMTDSVLHAIPLVGRAILASRFARALADLSSLKVHSMAYMAEMGEWPTKPEQLGLDAATFHTADIVEIGYR
ncbi:MAG: hypothetical protein HKP30_00995, partial [Myxococcales bacterium]|nr:hypothetical protein [Myxococcales bacterium]